MNASTVRKKIIEYPIGFLVHMKYSLQSVILGPSDELGLNVFQGVTSRTQSEDEDPFDEPEGAVAVIPAKSTAEASLKPSPVEPARLAVNLEAWNNFLEQSYPHQHPSGLEHAVEDISDTPLQLKDSGIARPSFSTSVDVLGTHSFFVSLKK